jgi:hypothetical protein
MGEPNLNMNTVKALRLTIFFPFFMSGLLNFYPMISSAQENPPKKIVEDIQNVKTGNAVSNEEIDKLIKELEKSNVGKEELYKT